MSVRALILSLRAALLLVAVLACPAQAFAESLDADRTKEQRRLDAFRAAFAQQYPATAIDQIRATPLAGLFEIRAGGNVFYTDAQARYVLFGHLFDLHTQTDLSASSQAGTVRIAWHSLPLQHALVQRLGNGARRLAVFADPQCPHCRALAATLEQLSDITVYTFIVPMLGPRSAALAQAVWCAPDPGQAWARLMRAAPADAPPSQARCATPAAAIQRVVDAHGIAAVPTLFNARGVSLRGAPSLEQLQRFVMEEH